MSLEGAAWPPEGWEVIESETKGREVNPRDELALTLRQKFSGWMGPAVSYDVADAILAAGYSKNKCCAGCPDCRGIPGPCPCPGTAWTGDRPCILDVGHGGLCK